MCGIIGYSGKNSARSVILTALSNLEYRGYDSAGLALWEEGNIYTSKSQGRLQRLCEQTQGLYQSAHTGIGHTRWATHGCPNHVNAHPHHSGKVTLVHNGIIENYRELKEELTKQGYSFLSETDTEIAAALIDSCTKLLPNKEAICAAVAKMEGSYAFCILFDDAPDCIYAVRRGSPLIAAVDASGVYIASDMPAVLEHTRNYYLLEEGELACVEDGVLTILNKSLLPVQKELLTASWSVEQAQKGGYDFFMLKEINEQPRALADTVLTRIVDGLPSFAGDGLPQGFFRDITRIHISACGTALYSGMVGKALIEKLSRLPVDVDIASELRYRNPIINPGEAAIIISQSGETADTLAALRLFKERNIPTIAIVNVVGSSIAREADYCLYTYAGPEIAVASTKAYSVQIAMMYLIGIAAAGDKGVSEESQRELVKFLEETITATPKALELWEAAERYAASLHNAHSLFYIGRGMDYSLALEGALKCKEISYIHSEAYAAGELKHGTISLITEGTPVIAIVTQKHLMPKTLSNIKEVKARGGRVLVITYESAQIDPDAYDEIIRIPDVEDLYAPLPVVIVLQMIAAASAIDRGCDVDKPRNLAKSVTVE